MKNTDIGFEKFEEDFYANPNTMYIKPENNKGKEIMEDVRSLYINQIINHYRRSIFDEPCESVTVTYRFQGAKENAYRIFSHNEGLDVVQNYIKDLEKKVDELQYIERIIQAAKEN